MKIVFEQRYLEMIEPVLLTYSFNFLKKKIILGSNNQLSCTIFKELFFRFLQHCEEDMWHISKPDPSSFLQHQCQDVLVSHSRLRTYHYFFFAKKYHTICFYKGRTLTLTYFGPMPLMLQSSSQYSVALLLLFAF